MPPPPLLKPGAACPASARLQRHTLCSSRHLASTLLCPASCRRAPVDLLLQLQSGGAARSGGGAAATQQALIVALCVAVGSNGSQVCANWTTPPLPVATCCSRRVKDAGPACSALPAAHHGSPPLAPCRAMCRLWRGRCLCRPPTTGRSTCSCRWAQRALEATWQSWCCTVAAVARVGSQRAARSSRGRPTAATWPCWPAWRAARRAAAAAAGTAGRWRPA